MMNRSRLLAMAAAGLTAIAGAACGTAGGDAWAGTITDSAGIQLVQNPVGGIWNASNNWQLVQDLQIGTAEGEPEYQFGAIAAIEVGDDGTIYALDQQGQHIKVFDASGAYVRTIGRGGAGLGELSAGVQGLALIPGDTLIVLDQNQARFTKFLTDGTAVGSFRMDIQGTGIPFRIEAGPGGGMIAQMRRLALPNAPGDSLDRVVRLSSDGTPLDTLLSIRSGNTISVVDGAPRWEFFSAEPLWAVREAGGVIDGINSAYRIEVRNAEGSLTHVVTRPFTPVPVEEAHADRMRDAIIEIARRQAGQPLPPQAIQYMQANMNFAPHYPVMGFIAEGPDGSIWVQQIRSVADLNESELENFNIQLDLAAPRWDVFDNQGRYLGEVTMPGRIQLFDRNEDAFYGVMRDDLDVQYIVRLRLERPAD